MPDYAVIAAALAGGVVGVVLMRLATWGGGRAEADRTRPAPGPPTPTGYSQQSIPTAGPILLAIGLALVGIGLAIGSDDAGLDALPLVPGSVVLVAALAATLRRGDEATGADLEASGDVNPASVARENSAVPSALDVEDPSSDREAPHHRRGNAR